MCTATRTRVPRNEDFTARPGTAPAGAESASPIRNDSGRTINVAGPLVRAPSNGTRVPSESTATDPSTFTSKKFASPMKSATKREVGRR